MKQRSKPTGNRLTSPSMHLLAPWSQLLQVFRSCLLTPQQYQQNQPFELTIFGLGGRVSCFIRCSTSDTLLEMRITKSKTITVWLCWSIPVTFV